MHSLNPTETSVLDRIEHDPMLTQVQAWSAINSGSANLAGLSQTAGLLADAFAGLPGDIELIEPAPAERVRADGVLETVEHGRHLVLSVRPDAAVQMLFTGHMDTVFPVDSAFQEQRWLEDGVLNGPGVADMKGGIAVMLAALSSVETAPEAARFGYQSTRNAGQSSPGQSPRRKGAWHQAVCRASKLCRHLSQRDVWRC